MKSKITLKDIARELDVAVSTVSKALHDSHEISEETKERIRAYAAYYKYRPNSLALKLRNQKTLVIGVVIPEIVHHFFSKVISGIEDIANKRGYTTMICLSNESYDKELLNIQMLANGSVDGIIMSMSKETLNKNDFDHLKELIEDDVPLLLFDRINNTIGCDKVIVDDIGGGYKAAKHLIEIGCKKIALLTSLDTLNVSSDRKTGYLKALQENGIKHDKNLILSINDDEDYYDQIEKLLLSGHRPDGIFAVNEIFAAIAMKIAQKNGFNVPKDISVIGFTDGLISEFSTPSLTTVAQHGFTMGQQSAEILINRIEGKIDSKNYQTKVISTNLKVRNSTNRNVKNVVN